MIFNNSIDILTIEDIIKISIDEFKASKQRSMMITGENYYKVDNEAIARREMYRYENGVAVKDETKVNNKLKHGFMHILVDDKVNYLLTKPYTLKCENEGYLDLVKKCIGNRFQKTLSRLGTQASNKGIAWLHPYISLDGEFKTMIIPSEQVIPLWGDNDHEDLQGIIRFYEQEYYEGKTKKTRTKVEYWTRDNVVYYVLDGGNLILDSEMYLDETQDYDGHFKINDQATSWGKVPFVAFKNNDMEIADIQFVKSLIDDYDLARSDISNMLEEIKNNIFVLKGYGGENLSDFMRDLAYYRAIKLDEDGEVNTIENAINIEAAKEHYEKLFRDINTFGQGVDKDPNSINSSTSGEALKFLYAGLDLKCNSIEEWFKWGFEELLYFIDMYLSITRQAYTKADIDMILNRDIMIRESAVIADAKMSMGVTSRRTAVSQHPWVDDIEEEMKLIEEEYSLEMEEYSRQQEEVMGDE